MTGWNEAVVETPCGPVREFGPASSLSDHATRFMVNFIRVSEGAAAAEAGCGTGVLSIYMALAGAKAVTATDIDRVSLEAARHNAVINGAAGISFIEGNLLEPVRGPLNLVTALLPHKPAPRPFNPRYYGGPDGTDLLLLLIDQAGSRIVPGGRLYLYVNSIANTPRVLAALNAQFRVRMAGEKRRHFTREEFDALTPGMFDYLCELRNQGKAEFHEDESGPYFMARVYEAERL